MRKTGLIRFAKRALLVLLLAPPVAILVLRFVPPPPTPLMLVRWIEGDRPVRVWTPLDRIAPSLPRLVVAGEDNGFCIQRFGIDTAALREQIDARLDGDDDTRGASTITMQLARNLFLPPSRTILRKGAELWLTPQLAVLWSKRRVIEVYLNVAEFGPGLFGAEAASRAYFHKSAAQLSDDEAARLAAILPAPRSWSADHPGPYVRERARILRRRETQLGPLLDCLGR
jgi:monofunctional biosynthetic peptidoglycan transglycosylase